MGGRQTSGRAGFTLIEVLTALAVLALLAALLVPSMAGFLDRSAQTARNNIARTLFMAAQSALTARYGRGVPFDASDAVLTPVQLSGISPAIDAAELAQNGGNIYALSLQKGAASGALYDLLSPYVGDKAALGNAILIEFNIKTGNVLACFYSDAQAAFSHGSSGYNVTQRGKDALKSAKVGYFAVEFTGKEYVSASIGDVAVRLADYTDPAGTADGVNGGHNYGLLTAECELPLALRDNYVYTLTLSSSDASVAGTDTLTFGGPSADADIALDDALRSASFEEALLHPIRFTPSGSISQRTVYAFCEERAGRTLLVIVLDSVDTNAAIKKNFPALGCGYLAATLTVTDGTETVEGVFDDPVHTLYGGKTQDGGAFTIASVRHLQNVRYRGNAAFVQTADVYAYTWAGALLSSFTPLCCETDVALGGTLGFSGVYDGGAHKIVDLAVSNAAYAGLFRKVLAGGAVRRIELAYDKVTGATMQGGTLAGGVAAENAGSILSCTVRGRIVSANGAAGGVAGENLSGGKIAYAFVAANVSARTAAGGVAGRSGGSVAYCEVGTASKKETGEVTGTPYFGARYPNDSYTYRFPDSRYAVSNDAFNIEAVTGTPNNAAGGIVGVIPAKTGHIIGCVNAAQVNARGGAAGGILGRSENAAQTDLIVSWCYNAGNVVGGSTASSGGRAGGVVGELSGQIKVCYNTGLVNVDAAESQYNADAFEVIETMASGSAPGLHYNPNDGKIKYLGGIIGFGTSTASVADCYSAAPAGDRYGGAFGLMNPSSTVARCYYLRNAHNTESSYYIRETGGTKLRSTGLTRLASPSLRNSSSRFSSGTFAEGTSAGEGPWAYTLPYFDMNVSGEYVCTLGENFHRTPWSVFVESYGDVALEDNASGDIFVRFWLLPNKADLWLSINEGRSDDEIDVLALSQANITSLKNATESRPATLTAGGYTFTGYSKTASAERRLMGYGREYVLKLHWPGSGGANALPAGSVTLKAYLYASGQSGSAYRYAESNRIDRLVQVVQGPGNDTTLLKMALNLSGGNPELRITVVYPDTNPLSTQTIVVGNGAYNSAPTGYYLSLYAYQKWQHFQGGAGTFPIYSDGSGTYYLVLNTDDLGWLVASFAAPNGFLTDARGRVLPFYIQVSANGETFVSPRYEDWP